MHISGVCLRLWEGPGLGTYRRLAVDSYPDIRHNTAMLECDLHRGTYTGLY